MTKMNCFQVERRCRITIYREPGTKWKFDAREPKHLAD